MLANLHGRDDPVDECRSDAEVLLRIRCVRTAGPPTTERVFLRAARPLSNFAELSEFLT